MCQRGAGGAARALATVLAPVRRLGVEGFGEQTSREGVVDKSAGATSPPQRHGQ
jgi:hypothetical protein